MRMDSQSPTVPSAGLAPANSDSSTSRISHKIPDWIVPFEPHPWLTNGHLQTIVGNFLPRPAFSLVAKAETVEVDPADASRVLCHCHWQPKAVRATRLTAVLLHGLE